jgi:hypothetical protein
MKDEYEGAIEVSIVFHEGNRMFAVPKHPAPVQPVAQWQKRHPARTAGKWENTNEHDAKWWRDKAQGWDIRALYTTPPAQPAPVQEPVECQYGNGGYACCEGGPCKADEQNNAAQPAPVQDSTCSETLRSQGKAYPRTCRKCGKGPCIGAPKQPPAAQPAVPLTDEMVTAAARALNKRQAEACGVDKNDHWKFYGDDIKEDAKAALEAAHGITKGQP